LVDESQLDEVAGLAAGLEGSAPVGEEVGVAHGDGQAEDAGVGVDDVDVVGVGAG
jgi:hypothetical protein